MNENETNNAAGYSADEDILRAVRRRLAAVEPMIPVPPAWTNHDLAPVRVRPIVRSGVRFAFAPLIVVAAIVAVAIAGGTMGRPPAVSSPSGDYLEETYRLVNPTGENITADQLEIAAKVLEQNANRFGIAPPTVSKIGPDELLVRISGNLDGAGPMVGIVRQVRFVLLPPETYGTSNAPGVKEVPAAGAFLDTALPAQFTGADLDPASIQAELNTTNGGGVWAVDFAFRSEKAGAFETWTGQHVDDYFAIALDNEVLTVPYVQSAVTGGKGVISGQFTEAEAKELAVTVEMAALGLRFELVESHQYLAAGSTLRPAVTQPPMTNAPTQGATRTASGSLDPGEPASVIGSGNGPEIQVWLDFKCAACKTFHDTVLPKLLTQYVDTGKARIAFFDMTVIDQATGGRESLDAANAARCAADQGKYLEYANVLFANQGAEGDGSLTKDRLIALAQPLALDQTAFATCVRNDAHDAAVQATTQRATNLVEGVPAIVLGGAVTTDSSYETISNAIDAMLAATPAATSPVTPAATSPGSQPSPACSIVPARSGEPAPATGACTGGIGRPSPAASLGS